VKCSPLPDIGIIGAGTAGLHLALMLQQRGVHATLYAERGADDVLAGNLPNTVAHHHHTRARERALGVNHWDGDGPSYARHWHYFGGEHPLAFPGDFLQPSLAVDYRLYLSRLLEDFCRRVDERRLPFVLGAFDWTNFMTAPEPQLFDLVGAMSQNSALVDDFTENFNHPDRQWEHLSTPEATAAYIARFGPSEPGEAA
jgi:hypothetical protein